MLRTVRVPLLFLFVFPVVTSPSSNKNINKTSIAKPIADSAEVCPEEKPPGVAIPDIYDSIGLGKKGLSKDVFVLALKGYNYLLEKRQLVKKDIISIIDFSKASDQKRLYILDIKNYKLLFHSLVAHGHNSGLEYAKDFSNESDSHKSSLGFYVTLGTYTGECGYALRLKGCERGFNDKAYDRNIVMHGSEYVNENFIHSNGFLGRSWGCPAVPEKLHKKIIDAIKKRQLSFHVSSHKKNIC